MAYEARRDDLTKEEEQEQKKAESDAANAKAARVGLEVGSKTGGWWGAAMKGIKTADDASGGRITDAAGKLTTHANKLAPFAQGITNKVANSEIADKAYDVYKKKNSKGADAVKDDVKDNVKDNAEKAKEASDKVKEGGEKKDSLPSSADKNESIEDIDFDGKDSGDKKSSSKLAGIVAGTSVAPVMIITIPILIVIVLFVVVLSLLADFSDYQDAFGISQIAGLDTGGVDGSVADPEQNAFYERIMEVRNDFQQNGKTVDPLMVVSVYHALNLHGANIAYKSMTTSKITKIADAMFDGNVYSESTFKGNLKSSIIPSYLPFANESKKEAIITETFEYIERYYSLIGYDNANCSDLGNCTYNIKGFYISGSNFKKNITVNNLYVRLMQCGSYNGHNAGGTWGYPLEGEELVPFEKYILGVAYQEIGPGAPTEAFKAQMIAARSYILARPTQMGSSTSWRKLEKENGKWILQVAACTADQVYCDPDKGCSAENGDGQWKQVYSGTNHGKKIKGPLAADSPVRKYAAQVQGETLVNNQGYIVLTDYTDTETQKFSSLARSGYDYKQILMQVYGGKYSGISDISKANCGSCVSNGEYTSWKQYEGDWASVGIGNSGKTIKQIGCLVTSLAIQIAKSGVQTNVTNFNPGTFVSYLNNQNAFSDGGALLSYDSVESVAPSFKYQGYTDVGSLGREEKLNTIKSIVSQSGVYAIAEVKGSTGQHWVAIDSVNGDTINMMDPGSTNTDMWGTYDWYNTSRIVYYKVS